MSVGRILTLGFGSFGGVQYLPTLGYASSSTPPAPAEDTVGFAEAVRRVSAFKDKFALSARRKRDNKDIIAIVEILAKIGMI